MQLVYTKRQGDRLLEIVRVENIDNIAFFDIEYEKNEDFKSLNYLSDLLHKNKHNVIEGNVLSNMYGSIFASYTRLDELLKEGGYKYTFGAAIRGRPELSYFPTKELGKKECIDALLSNTKEIEYIKIDNYEGCVDIKIKDK